MKKIVKYLVAAVAMVAAVSCQEELALNERPAQNSGMPVFTASLNNLNTRTVLEEESMKTLWTGGEWIDVMDFEGVNNIYSTPALEEPAQKVDFSLKEGGQFYGNSVFALYPHSEKNMFWANDDEGVFGVIANHPENQTATVGTFDTFGAVHVAYNADFEANNNLVFNNLSALIKFTVTDPGVKKLTFYGLSGELVSGPIKYRYEDGKYAVEDATEGLDYVDLYAPSGQYLEMGKNYYIAVAPGTFENGVAIEVNNHLENKIVYKHEGKVVLNPNTINNFGSFVTNGDLTWGLVGDTINNWGEKEDVVLEKKGDMFVYEGYTFSSQTQFKIRATNQWNDDANYGLTFKNFAEENGVYDLTNGGWSQNIFVRPGTYDIWFDPFGMKLYMMEPGVEPAEAETIVPTRYVVGAFNGWPKEAADTTYKMQWDGSWFTSVVEFTEEQADNGGYPFKVNPGDWSFDWGAKDGFKYESGVVFETGGSNVVLPEPGFYMIQQSWDGYSMVVTDVVAPARGSQIYIPEAGLILDLGVHVAGKLSVVWALDYPIYKDAVIGSYDYKILPDSPTTGKIAYESDAFATDGYTYIYYSFDNDGVMSVAGELGFEGYAEAEVWTEDGVMVFEDRPEVILEGMWVGYTSTDDLVLLDMTEEKKLTYSYLAKDADGNECWIKMIDSEAYTINEYEFATSLAVDEVERVTLFPVSKEAMILAGNKAVKFLDEEIEIWPITSLKEEDLPETFYNAPDFKQWGFVWAVYGGANAVLDFGVTMPGTCVVAYDPAIMGAPEGTPHQIFNAIQYSFAPADDESGKLTLLSTNMYGEILSQEFEYSDYTGETCYFAFGEDSFVAQDVDGKLVNVTVDANGGIAQ